jgi:ClpP class serine protease
VAEGRGVSEQNVRRNYGQGRMVMAKDAVEAGMADRVGTLGETINRLMSGATPGRVRVSEPQLELVAETNDENELEFIGDQIDEMEAVAEATEATDHKWRLTLMRKRLHLRGQGPGRTATSVD